MLAVVSVIVLAALVLDHSPSARAEERSSDSQTFDDVAFMGGIKRTSEADAFRSGQATAVMGGAEIDLRAAIMDRSEAVLEVSSIMGGVKVRVPESWTVVSHVDTIMGGFEDRSRHPARPDHRLILKGAVVMGGLKITN